jgi:hypothetical protein
MALGTMAKYGVPVTIQCVGLNYYEGYKFRSNAAINFGPTYTIPESLVERYRIDKRGAIAELLSEITIRMKSCYVSAESYEELQQLFTARSVYKPA